jgi:hypothetical protein
MNPIEIKNKKFGEIGKRSNLNSFRFRILRLLKWKASTKLPFHIDRRGMN